MISEGSCDIQDFSDSCWEFRYAIINYILKYIKTENFLLYLKKNNLTFEQQCLWN